MNKDKLLFYHIYEDFYAMAAHSPAFRAYCEAAFGVDFSQDGFSDLRQIDFVLSLVSLDKGSRVLDIGCGNGKMLGYVKQKTGAAVEGFDYSDNAIRTARQRAADRASFQVGVIGEIDYPPARFDLITSMDTMYFGYDGLRRPDFSLAAAGRAFHLRLSGGRPDEKDPERRHHVASGGAGGQ